MNDTRPLWFSADAQRRAPVTTNVEVDAAVVGMGITGLSAALELTRAGQRVCVIEKAFLGAGETGHTTAHLTELLDSRYSQLIRDFGVDGAKLAAESTRWALDAIEGNTRTLGISCAFSRVPAFLYADGMDDDQDPLEVEEECAAAVRAGVQAELRPDVPLPFAVRRALRIDHQAQFHPLAYLQGIAQDLERHGARLFEDTVAVKITDGEPCEIETDRGHVIRARNIVMATNVPVNDRVLFHTQAFAYRTYAVAARTGDHPEPGLYFDLANPYHYIRTQQTSEGRFLIVGGEDHKVGKEDDTRAFYERLEHYTRQHFQIQAVERHWSGQVIEPSDGLPYIGRNPGGHHVFVATGYSGNGITFGTIAGHVLSDLILGRANRFAELYQATRVKPLASAADMLTENVDFPKHLVLDRLRPAETRSLAEVARGEGKIVSLQGKKTAVYRDEDGKCLALSPVCTHLGCHVKFNTAEKSWDCPCHGGRFDLQGEVLNGPPLHALKRVPERLPEEERAPGTVPSRETDPLHS